jgi:hypothetical protein
MLRRIVTLVHFSSAARRVDRHATVVYRADHERCGESELADRGEPGASVSAGGAEPRKHPTYRIAATTIAM